MSAPAPVLEIQAAARLLAEGRAGDAVPRLEALVAAAPAYAAALVLLARAYDAAGRDDEALAAWHRAFFLAPTSGLVRRERDRLLARAAAFPSRPGPAAAPAAEEAPPLAETPGGDLPEARLALIAVPVEDVPADDAPPAEEAADEGPDLTAPTDRPVDPDDDDDALLSEALLAEAAGAPSETAVPWTWTDEEPEEPSAPAAPEPDAPADEPPAEPAAFTWLSDDTPEEDPGTESPAAESPGEPPPARPPADHVAIEAPPPPVHASPMPAERASERMPEAFTWVGGSAPHPPVEPPAAASEPPSDAFGGEHVFSAEPVFARAPGADVWGASDAVAAPDAGREEADAEEADPAFPTDAPFAWLEEDPTGADEPGGMAEIPIEPEAPSGEPPAASAASGWTVLDETTGADPSPGTVEAHVAPPAGFAPAPVVWGVVRRPPPVEDVEPVEEAAQEAPLPGPPEDGHAEEIPGEDPPAADGPGWEDGPPAAPEEEPDDLDALIRQLEGATRIRPDPHFVPAPVEEETDDLDDDLVSETLARIYAAQHQYAEAAVIYEKLARQRPDAADEFLRKAADLRAHRGGDPGAVPGEPGT